MNPTRELMQAFDNKAYLHSREGRIIRVLAEFSEPKHRFEKAGILDTIVFFGSARTLPLKEAKKNLAELKQKKRVSAQELNKARTAVQMAAYYEDATRLSCRLSRWAKSMTKTFAICSGGGPGIMEAVNKGARMANFPSIGFNISLPFEQAPNSYISRDLSFEFHYFFLRKFWFLYLAKALVIFPGGFGTMDEMMEVFTLVQTKKIQKDLIVILFGEEFWKKTINFDYLVEAGMIDDTDLRVFKFCSTVDEAFKVITNRLGRLLDRRKGKGHPGYDQPLVLGI
jgi:uncharacterized protein (TIGR00730 family)